jgi:hypothetical protein
MDLWFWAGLVLMGKCTIVMGSPIFYYYGWVIWWLQREWGIVMGVVVDGTLMLGCLSGGAVKEWFTSIGCLGLKKMLGFRGVGLGN